jgi:hypothetical protein
MSQRLIGRLIPSNYQCNEHDLADCHSLLSDEHFASLLNIPLGQIQLDQYIDTSVSSSTKSDQLPFDISRHPFNSSLVARDIISRLKQDMTTFCAQNKDLRISFFAALPAEAVERIVNGTPGSEFEIQRCWSSHEEFKDRLLSMRESCSVRRLGPAHAAAQDCDVGAAISCPHGHCAV